MRRHANVVEVLEHVFGDAIVQHALAVDHLVLLGVEGGRVVLEMLDEGSRLRPLIEDLRLALVDATAAIHRDIPWFEKIHGWAEAPKQKTDPRLGRGATSMRRNAARPAA